MAKEGQGLWILTFDVSHEVVGCVSTGRSDSNAGTLPVVEAFWNLVMRELEQPPMPPEAPQPLPTCCAPRAAHVVRTDRVWRFCRRSVSHDILYMDPQVCLPTSEVRLRKRRTDMFDPVRWVLLDLAFAKTRDTNQDRAKAAH